MGAGFDQREAPETDYPRRGAQEFRVLGLVTDRTVTVGAPHFGGQRSRNAVWSAPLPSVRLPLLSSAAAKLALRRALSTAFRIFVALTLR
jgi:hypothetical protein